VGSPQHHVLLIPSIETTGYYTVWAKLAPEFAPQQWETEAPLDMAQQQAERQVRLLVANEKNRILVDRHAAWRAHPASLKQLYTLRHYGIAYDATLTAGQASDLIGRKKVEEEKRKADEKAEKAATRSTRPRRKARESA
jgi:hypothetical protein